MVYTEPRIVRYIVFLKIKKKIVKALRLNKKNISTISTYHNCEKTTSTIRSFRGNLEIYYSKYCGQHQNSNFLRIKWFLYLMWTCSVLRAGRTIALVWTQYSSFVGTTAVLHSNVVLPT